MKGQNEFIDGSRLLLDCNKKFSLDLNANDRRRDGAFNEVSQSVYTVTDKMCKAYIKLVNLSWKL
jgi:hypothetical protein